MEGDTVAWSIEGWQPKSVIKSSSGLATTGRSAAEAFQTEPSMSVMMTSIHRKVMLLRIFKYF
jgi:hypothetical protein